MFRLASAFVLTLLNTPTLADQLLSSNQPSTIGHGLTWAIRFQDTKQRVVSVGCHASNHRCDPYQGNALCTDKLPVLCINKQDNTASNGQLKNWSNGIVAITPAVSPTKEGWRSVESANLHCESNFGKGWRMAEHHDGGHWYFSAMTEQPISANEFWVHINDQPLGNCW